MFDFLRQRRAEEENETCERQLRGTRVEEFGKKKFSPLPAPSPHRPL